MKYTFLSLLLMALSTFSIKASTIGYTNGTISRTSVFRMGSTTKQGQAIRLSKEKLQMLKGKSISAVNIAVGSRNTTGNTAHVFIATSLDGTPIAEGDLSLTKALQWLTYTLDTPYVITGEETELYIGYTAEIVTTYNMLSADFDADIPGCNYAYKDGEWTDTYGIGAGCANITAEIADAPSFCDIIMARNNLDGYYTAGKDYTFSAKIKNFGTKAVTSFNTDMDIDGKTIAMKVEGVNIQPGASYSITLPELSTTTSGNTPITISVNNVNDTDDDIDMSDNAYSENIFFYPADMERNMLVEGFTGQACSNCPAGHSIMNNAISKYAEIPAVVVEHHSGYYPDMFTMAEDMDYLFDLRSSHHGEPRHKSAHWRSCPCNRLHICHQCAEPHHLCQRQQAIRIDEDGKLILRGYTRGDPHTDHQATYRTAGSTEHLQRVPDPGQHIRISG